MENETQIAQALPGNQVIGKTRTIEARTDNGKALKTLVRMSYEVDFCMDDSKYEAINKHFIEFVEIVENLL